MSQTKNTIGLSLLELLIALTLSVMILSLLVTLYVVSQHSYSQQKNLDALMNSMEVMQDVISRDIHLAGFLGCHQRWLFERPMIEGDDHSFIVRHSGPKIVRMIRVNKNNLYVPKQSDFQVRDKVFISDCLHAEINDILSVATESDYQLIKLKSPVKYSYTANSEVSIFMENHYQIKNTGRVNAQHKAIYGLYVANHGHNAVGLVDGIDGMDMTYDIEFAHELLTMKAADIPDWQRVRGINIQWRFGVMNSSLGLQKKGYLYAALHSRPCTY